MSHVVNHFHALRLIFYARIMRIEVNAGLHVYILYAKVTNNLRIVNILIRVHIDVNFTNTCFNESFHCSTQCPLSN